jgi:hypothetical protein
MRASEGCGKSRGSDLDVELPYERLLVEGDAEAGMIKTVGRIVGRRD